MLVTNAAPVPAKPPLWVMAALALVGVPAVLVGMLAALLVTLIVTPFQWLTGGGRQPHRPSALKNLPPASGARSSR